jgi:predicted TIM-barrel fold metal-dependent hydrolase
MAVDAAAYLGAWPFRPIKGTVAGLRKMMRTERVQQALVSPLEGLFYADPRPANDRLLRRLAGRRSLWAAPVVNVRVADWREDLARLARRQQVRAVRVAPGFHGYRADGARAALEAAAEHDLAAVIQVRMQDERHQHLSAQRVEDAPLADIVALAAAAPEARVVASGARLAEALEQAEHIRQLANVWLDVSHFDGSDCLRKAAEAIGVRHLLFATNWPFFYARSSVLKVNEAELPRRDAAAVMERNAKTAFELE